MFLTLFFAVIRVSHPYNTELNFRGFRKCMHASLGLLPPEIRLLSGW